MSVRHRRHGQHRAIAESNWQCQKTTRKLLPFPSTILKRQRKNISGQGDTWSHEVGIYIVRHSDPYSSTLTVKRSINVSPLYRQYCIDGTLTHSKKERCRRRRNRRSAPTSCQPCDDTVTLSLAA
jgi:hypothetical protein